MKRFAIVVVAAVAELSQTGCFSSWVASQAAGNAKIWDEGVREESVPMPDFTEQLVVAMPLLIEMTPVVGTTPASPLPFALQCRAKQLGQDAVYHSAFRYGKSWKKGTAIMFLLEGLGAAALVFGGLEDDKPGNVVLGGLLGVDALGTAALFFAPRKDVYRRDERRRSPRSARTAPRPSACRSAATPFPSTPSVGWASWATSRSTTGCRPPAARC